MSRRPPHRSRGLRRTLLGGACALLLAACTPTLVRDGAQPASRPFLPAFAVEGRLSATDGRNAASGRFEWVHDDEQDRLTLFSPLGQVVALLEGDPAGASLEAADGSRREAADVDALLPEALGVDLPAARLPRWIQAAPAADAEVRASRRPTQIEEHLPGHERYAWSLVVRFPIEGPPGRGLHVGGFDIDISDMKRAESELAASREALHQSGASFVYISDVVRVTGGLRLELGTHVIIKAEYTHLREVGRIPEFPDDVLTTSLVVKL